LTDKTLINRELVLKFKGHLNFETIGMLLNKLKVHFDSEEMSLLLYKKLLTLMIETLENIFKYSDNFEGENHLFPTYLPAFTLEKTKNKYVLSSSNPVRNEHVQILSDKISCVNSLDGDGLKKLYKKTIANGQFSNKGGAGLGFIEMAKISKENLKLSIEKIDEHFSYYNLIVVVETKSNNQEGWKD